MPFIFRSAVTVTALALIALGAGAANAQNLTDVVLFRTDGNGNSIQEGWNTRGGDFVSNIFLKSGANFVNTGNGAAASIAIALSAPGTYTFGFAGDNVNTNTGVPLGINFFFDGNATTPSISAFGPLGGGFVANGNQTNTPSFGNVPGANTLTFVNNGRQITLSAFTYQTTGGPEQVSPFDNVPNGASDTSGSFTLTVATIGAAAPEPGTGGLVLLTLAALPVVGLTRGKFLRRK